MTTNIYALEDPSVPNFPRYVGKANNLSNRKKGHIKAAIHCTRNKPMSIWINNLLVQGKEPTIRVVEIAPLDSWQEREKYWIAEMRKINPDLFNVAIGGNEPVSTLENARRAGHMGGIRNVELHGNHFALPIAERLDACSRGGLNRVKLHGAPGSVQGPINVQNGHWERISKLARTPEHQAIAGRSGGKKGGHVSGHRRWHTARGVVNLNCDLCREYVKTVDNLAELLERSKNPPPTVISDETRKRMSDSAKARRKAERSES